MVSEHTPGPWKFEPYRFGWGQIQTFDGVEIAAVRKEDSYGETLPWQFNGTLLAAAPESHAVNVALVAWDTWRFGPTPETARLLREALTAIGYTGGLNASLGGIVDAARAAIAKAEGR
jgi:hypothetical protein